MGFVDFWRFGTMRAESVVGTSGRAGVAGRDVGGGLVDFVRGLPLLETVDIVRSRRVDRLVGLVAREDATDMAFGGRDAPVLDLTLCAVMVRVR